MSDNIKDILRNRLPEFMRQDGAPILEYVDAVGEVLDDLKKTIKLHDDYGDYRYVPESRLAVLSRRFAFDPPRNLPESMQRGIIRDIMQIYATKGTENALLWVFRLLAWRATFEYAWLLNPERYDPNIRDLYPQYYERDGLDSGLSFANSFYPRLNNGYFIGVENQAFHGDDNFFISGPLLIGRNELSFTGGGDAYDPFTPDIQFNISTDYNKIDFRNFVYGKEQVDSDGTYFYGRTIFSGGDNLRKIRIIGEDYPPSQFRLRDVVLKTPYIIVNVNQQDYQKFTQPYTDDQGNEFFYTQSETFAIAETLVNYFLYDTVRPANVKIILISSLEDESDELPITTELEDEFTSQPVEQEDHVTSVDEEDYNLIFTDGFLIGQNSMFIGAPTAFVANSITVVNAPVIGDETYDDQLVVSDTQFSYEFVNIDLEQNGSVFVSDEYPLRTPSTVTIDTDGDITVEARMGYFGDYSEFATISAGVHSFTSHDLNFIRFVSASDETNITITVNWESQLGYDLPVTAPELETI